MYCSDKTLLEMTEKRTRVQRLRAWLVLSAADKNKTATVVEESFVEKTILNWRESERKIRRQC